MHRVEKLKNLQFVLKSRELLRVEAAHILSGRLASESNERGAESLAEKSVNEGAAAWQACLSSCPFDPLNLSYLAAEVRSRSADLETARERHAEARRRTEIARANYAACDAQVSKAKSVIQFLKKRLRRRGEEKRLSAMEDRVAALWVAR